MTLNLTIQQAEALYQVFINVILPEQPADVAESLIKDLMVQVYKKLRAKLEAKLKGKGYGLALTDVEAKAYYVYFNNRELGKGWLYEQTFINNQIDQLNKQYA